MRVWRYAAPCGELVLGAYGDRLCMCDWATDGVARGVVMSRLTHGLGAVLSEERVPVLEMAARQLDEYFSGEREEFSVPLLPVGTDFQQRVWRELMNVPYGCTVPYRYVAEAMGHPQSVRAVAGAIGANGLSLFIPCHRVVGSDGSLTGYAGGLEAKQYLLGLERRCREVLGVDKDCYLCGGNEAE